MVATPFSIFSGRNVLSRLIASLRVNNGHHSALQFGLLSAKQTVLSKRPKDAINGAYQKHNR
jgi:hypothetical protein